MTDDEKDLRRVALQEALIDEFGKLLDYANLPMVADRILARLYLAGYIVTEHSKKPEKRPEATIHG